MRKIYSEPKKIGEIEIKNRFVRSATGERLTSEDGRVTDELIQFYEVLAEGGVGLIITGVTYVHANGKGIPNQLGIDKDDLIPGLRKLTEVVHKCGENCKIAVQLHHSGRQSMVLENPPAPSAVFEPTFNVMPREMTIKDIEDTVEAFAEAARRAKEAGFDAIQLHAAHGYLLSQFLSPYTNKRTDGYGGSTENRIKIIEEVYEKTVDMVGKHFPILIKMNVDDFLDGGIKLDESMKIAEKFSKMGFAAIETSGCMWEVILRTKKELGWHPAFNPEARIGIDSKEKEAYHLPYAKEIKKVIKIPLILVGGIRSLDVIEKILNEENADFIGLCRPLIREPDLPNKWLKGIGKITCECISCNGCTASLLSGSIRCTQKK
ncbi:MAG: NADH:flavin oxidoreductase [Candidatus Lokiarchaeota archaeon]|nr:NADH:flavin oxidoreductase [Candidatus Lokiarchaeota archaeon]